MSVCVCERMRYKANEFQETRQTSKQQRREERLNSTQIVSAYIVS